MKHPLQTYSPRVARWFAGWLNGYFRRNFDLVGWAEQAPPPEDRGGPLIVYTNHPGWWDPIHFVLLAARAFPDRRMFGPFEAQALEQYGFFRRIGAFGIETDSRRGAADFLRISREILAEPDTTLWITAQGRFSDPRSRPVELRSGVAHLIRSLDRGVVLPLAVEYPFWNERRPVALSGFGKPFVLDDEPQATTEAWNDRLASRLAETMDVVAAVAESRDAGRVRPVVTGRSGIGGVYDLWRRGVATLRGRRFDPRHEDRPR